MKDFQDKGENENFDENGAEAVPAGDETVETGFETATENSPQKSALLLLVMIILVGGGGIYFMRMKAGPSAAQASPETAQANTAISEFLTDGGKNINQMKDMLRNTEKVVQGFLQYPSMTQVKLEELKTNPFEAQKPRVAKPVDDLVEKARLAAIEKQRQEIRSAASRLQLQSILYADNRGTCMIGGRACTQGQEVNGFTIEQIDRSFVVVRKAEYRFKLTMQQPQ
jgi:flagellar basal body-associated protein FliL